MSNDLKSRYAVYAEPEYINTHDEELEEDVEERFAEKVSTAYYDSYRIFDEYPSE